MPDSPQVIDQITPKPKRRYGWWIVGALVVLLFAVCLPIVIPYQRQISLIERIERGGGKVWTEPAGPDWLRNIVGDQRMRGFDDVTIIDVASSQADHQLISDIAGLTELKLLRLDKTQVTDSDLVHLKGLSHLNELFLNGTQITDAGLAELTELNSLESLSLNDTQITDAGLKHLSRMPHLKHLFLWDTQVSEACFEDLKGMTQLEGLYIKGPQVTKSGKRALQAVLPNCVIH